MKKILRKIISLLRFLKYLDKGGVMTVTISQLPANQELLDKVCVVTGGAVGLGSYITHRLLTSGATVIMISSSEKHINEALEKENSDRLFGYVWNLNNITDINGHLKKICEQTPQNRIDAWINNAAFVSDSADDIGGNSTEIFDKTFDLNVRSLFFVSEAVCEYFKYNNIQGKIVNISSRSSALLEPKPYHLSKYTVNGITMALAKKYMANGIYINAIGVGMLPIGINETDITLNAYNSQTASKRFVLPEEVAELVQFLLDNRGNSIIGQIIFCDGGDNL
ncbi:MAG: SDR family oxidoreductase [Paludibacteraceae bacterium]|nr:SDR family oxidoreductase [Paludibacteraceae bacterium]